MSGHLLSLGLVSVRRPTSQDLISDGVVGDMMIFGPYLSHRSAVNRSNTDRKALYATYNRTSEGELHDAYYTRRAEHWPATHLRQPDKGYSEGQLIYGYGSPMLSVVTGKQLVFAEWKILVKTSTT